MGAATCAFDGGAMHIASMANRIKRDFMGVGYRQRVFSRGAAHFAEPAHVGATCMKLRFPVNPVSFADRARLGKH